MKFYGVAVTVFGLVICVIPSPDQSKEASQLSIHYPDGTVVDVESVLDPY